jgi:rSAM/selenodomain-associated transferase 2
MISIIIPVLNEAENIKSLLVHLTKNASEKNISEILIIDGGSIDGTQNIVSLFSETSIYNINILASKKGRAKQMNLGAQNASGSILYFLHADSFPPINYDNLIISEIEKGNPAGCFKMKFDSNHWWLQIAGWLTKFNWRACRGGDQSQFIAKNLFNEIGGFDENYIIYEDNILINELYKRKTFVVIQKWLITSARLYREKGIWNLQYHFFIIYTKKWFGADAEELHTYYVKNIKGLKKLNNEYGRSKKEVLINK